MTDQGRYWKIQFCKAKIFGKTTMDNHRKDLCGSSILQKGRKQRLYFGSRGDRLEKYCARIEQKIPIPLNISSQANNRHNFNWGNVLLCQL